MRNLAPIKTDTFGTCAYSKTSPSKEKFSSETKILNVILTFEEALKLNLAVDECIRSLGRYKRSTKEGRKTALNISIHINQRRITIHEAKLKE